MASDISSVFQASLPDLRILDSLADNLQRSEKVEVPLAMSKILIDLILLPISSRFYLLILSLYSRQGSTLLQTLLS